LYFGQLKKWGVPTSQKTAFRWMKYTTFARIVQEAGSRKRVGTGALESTEDTEGGWDRDRPGRRAALTTVGGKGCLGRRARRPPSQAREPRNVDRSGDPCGRPGSPTALGAARILSHEGAGRVRSWRLHAWRFIQVQALKRLLRTPARIRLATRPVPLPACPCARRSGGAVPGWRGCFCAGAGSWASLPAARR
jgi:hypothetical protein